MTTTGLTGPNATLPYDGTGIAVAVIDSGMNNYEDLKDSAGHNRIVYQQSFIPGDNGTGDAYGHGNHVAGIIGGTGKKSTGASYDYKIRGIAPNVKFVNLRVLDKTGASGS
jgi:serine protease AprX